MTSLLHVVLVLTVVSTAKASPKKIVACSETSAAKKSSCMDKCMLPQNDVYIPKKKNWRCLRFALRELDLSFKYHEDNRTVTWHFPSATLSSCSFRNNLTFTLFYSETDVGIQRAVKDCCDVPIQRKNCQPRLLERGYIYFGVRYGDEWVGNGGNKKDVEPIERVCRNFDNHTLLCLIDGVFEDLKNEHEPTNRNDAVRDMVTDAYDCSFELPRADVEKEASPMSQDHILTWFERKIWNITDYYVALSPSRTRCSDTKLHFEKNVVLNVTEGMVHCYQYHPKNVAPQHFCMPDKPGMQKKAKSDDATVHQLQIVYILAAVGSLVAIVLVTCFVCKLSTRVKTLMKKMDEKPPVMVDIDKNLQSGAEGLQSESREKEVYEPLVVVRVDPGSMVDQEEFRTCDDQVGDFIQAPETPEFETPSVEEGFYLDKGSATTSSGVTYSSDSEDSGLAETTVSTYKVPREIVESETKYARLQNADAPSSSDESTTGTDDVGAIPTSRTDDVSAIHRDVPKGFPAFDGGLPELNFTPGDFSLPGNERLVFETLFAKKLQEPDQVPSPCT